MTRIKYTVDYLIKSSPTILFDFLSTPSRLSQWIDDHVAENTDQLVLYWEAYPEKATIIDAVRPEFIRFEMESGEDDEYLEFKIEKSEVTSDTILIITDFADKADIPDQKKLWDSQIKTLTNRVGGSN